MTRHINHDNIPYNSKINFEEINENSLIKLIRDKKTELLNMGLSKKEIDAIMNDTFFDVDNCSFNTENILITILICELLWYNNVYKEYLKFKRNKMKMSIIESKRLNRFEEIDKQNTFFSVMAQIIQKYGNELLEDL